LTGPSEALCGEGAGNDKEDHRHHQGHALRRPPPADLRQHADGTEVAPQISSRELRRTEPKAGGQALDLGDDAVRRSTGRGHAERPEQRAERAGGLVVDGERGR